MPLAPLRPWTPEESQSTKAARLTDAELAPEAQQASMAAGFGALSQYLTQNEFALQNVLNRRRTGKTNRRIISEIGFRELGHIGLPATGTVPTFQYLPPKEGQVLDRSKDPLPIIFVMHSFGGGFDLGRLRNRSVRSVSVDADTGFNPARFFNGINECIKPGSEKSIHHLISRRGDLVNSTPWDMTAKASGGPNNDLQKPSINPLSISIELEEYYVRHGDEKYLNAIINRVPYTDQQYAVVAFLLKKFIAWTGHADVLRWLGPTTEALAATRSRQPGCTIHRVFNPPHADPSAEFLFPPGFKKGDPIPSHLQIDEKGNKTAAKYEKRIELFWGDVPDGTPLSAWDRIFEKVAKIREFDLNTEVFDTQFVNPQIPLETPTITGTHLAAVANKIGQDQLAAVVRSQSLQEQSRAQMYSLAREASETQKSNLGTVFAKLEVVNKRTSKPSIIENALELNYATGVWSQQDTKVKA